MNNFLQRVAAAACLGVLAFGCSARSQHPGGGDELTGTVQSRLDEADGGGAAGDAGAAEPVEPTTFVSLTFDDTLADQYQARALLADHGMHGTFYTISSRINFDGNSMTLAQLRGLAADGNEIGGHTVSHPDVATLGGDDAKREICNDRAALLALGFPVKHFAYPFGSPPAQSPLAPAVQQALADCGYLTARGTGDIVSPGSCLGCPYADSIPPGRPMHVRTPDSVKLGTTLDTMKSYVTQAENHGGGWVVVVMHHICDGCNPYSVPRQELSDFLDWLQPRQSVGTVVRTVGEIIGGPLKPSVAGPPRPLPSPGSNLLKNASLEDDANHDALPDCWQRGGSGTNAANYTLTSDAIDGAVAERIEMTSFSSGARRLVTKQDTGLCAPLVRTGHSYTASAAYKADTPARFIAYYLDGASHWIQWAQGPWLPAVASYTQSSWAIPKLPDNATAVSVGISIFNVGNLYLDQLAVRDQDLTLPVVRLTNPTDGARVTGTVQLTATATDAGGIDHVVFLLNGEPVAAPVTQISQGTYALNWDTTLIHDGEGSITARAYDLAGNIASSDSALVSIANIPPPDNTPPTLVLTAPPADSFVQGNVDASATASDNAAVQRVSFFVNGRLLANVDTAPYVVTWNSDTADEGEVILSATAADTSGNETTRTVRVFVDHTAPTVTLVSPVSGATVSGDVVLAADANDNLGVDYVDFFVDGASAGRASTSPWTLTFHTLGVADGTLLTITAVAVDRAGATAASDMVTVSVDNTAPDSTPPQSSAACNDVACSSSYYNAPVSLSLTGLDSGGSGLAAIVYTLDGSVPDFSHGARYTAPISITTDSDIRYRAFDNAGNLEAVNLLHLAVDRLPPTLSASCNGAACASGWYPVDVQVALTSADVGSSGLSATNYSLDGTDPATGSGAPYSTPFVINSDSALRAVAMDNAGNSTSLGPIQIGIDKSVPVVAARCNGVACASTWSSAPLNVSLTATSAGNSGISAIRYTLDGTPPLGGATYSSALVVSSVAQLRAVAINAAGTVSAEVSQSLQVDVAAPSVSISSPTSGANVLGTVAITANPADNTGVVRARFYMDAKQLGTRVASPWKWNWDTTTATKGTHTLTVRAEDAAGNTATSNAVNVVVK